MIMYKMNFSTDHLRNVFAEENKYENFRKLCYDLNHGNDIYEYDEETGEKVKLSKHQANQAVRKVLMEVAELTEEDLKSEKRFKRMLKKHADEIFELIEEDIDFKVETGFRDSEWFERFVDYRNLALGDDEEFWTVLENNYFVVAEISGDHHDLTMQHMAPNTPTRVHKSHYGMKVGKDIDLVLLGRIDFTALTDKIAEAFLNFVQTECYNEVYTAASKLPNNSQFNKTGALGAATKSAFDELLEDVSVANNCPVQIWGTQTALKKLTALADVNWASVDQKRDIADMGRLGSYEGTVLVEIPQRFALNDVTTKLYDNTKLLIFPATEDRFVKVVDVGETEVLAGGDNKGDNALDFRTYEVQRMMGIGTQLGQYFGCWTTE